MKRNYKALTQSQLSIWTGQQLNPEAPLYNMAHSFDIEGFIDNESFKTAFDQLIERAEVLRTVFSVIDGIPVQSIQTGCEKTIEILDFSSKKPKEIKNWMKRRSQINFDFTKPLFDSVLIKVNEQRHFWFLNIHHLVTDATTSTILYKLQVELYKSILEGSTLKIKDVPAFDDYLVYKAVQKKLPISQTIRDHWKTKIDSLTVPLKIYGKECSATTSLANRVSLKLGVDRSKRLKDLASRSEIRSWTQDLTLFNLFTTAIFTYLHRVSGQQKFAIGAPSHNRSTKSFKRTPGLFIEIFPLLSDFEDKDTFFSVLEKVKLETNDYLKNAQPGMSSPELSRSFNVVLNYINVAFPDFNGMPMQSEWIHPEHCDPGHQLRCHVYDMNASGDIEVHFDLNNDVFHESLQNEIPQHFLKVLDALIEDVNQSIYEPSLIDKVSAIDLQPISEFIPIIKQFELQAIQTPDATALSFKNTSYTYQKLNQKANQFANYLLTKGINSEKRVAVHLERSPEYIVAVLGILKTGASFIPISSDQPSQRVSYILKDSNCHFILTNNRLVDNITSTQIPYLNLDDDLSSLLHESIEFKCQDSLQDSLAYMIYTSGSTGNPKGVLISNKAICNYLNWAKSYYATKEKFVFPLFTSVGFDLTITSTFLPLITGGELIVYSEADHGPDISLMEVLAQNKVNSIKLTPSHLALIRGADMQHSNIKTMIVGGEDFKVNIAQSIQNSFSEDLRIYNEYGPTEATVGCIAGQYTANHTEASVPIGTSISGMSGLVLDSNYNQVPAGVVGELHLSGFGLAEGYCKLTDLTSEKFVTNPFNPEFKMYRTGDLVRLNEFDEFEYLGRVDEQVKLRGFRLELTDVEANLLTHNNVQNTAVVIIENEKVIPEHEVVNCLNCGLPSNYPNTDFDEHGVCHVCNAFEGYKDQAQKYFKSEEELRNILTSQRGKSPNYDCISLLSGGKDSTYILAQLINMGLRVLAFTLDNGYISEQAKENIDRIVSKLEVDHIYGTTEHMNAIFVDSLHRHQNVCNGCFKTIYTLSTQIALAKQIPYVVTGLSRGQFFETRLTEELFWDENADVSTIDDTILEARKLYHQEEDAVKELIDVSMFDYDDTFNKVQFIDFYRYSDVTLDEMLRFLKEKVDWVRPTDTGRSTNCLINQLGIYVHKKEKGYSNYSFPYSWDVRMGHKTRTETLEEINEVIDEKEVKRIADEIGYQVSGESELKQKNLVCYYTGEKTSSAELLKHLKQALPEYMVPSYFKYVEKLPLTKNGKVDKAQLKMLSTSQLDTETPFVAPNGDIEELIGGIWKEVLRLKQVSVHDNFIALGGHSLAAIRVTARINEEIEMKFPLSKIFEFPTIIEYANYIEETLTKLLDEQD